MSLPNDFGRLNNIVGKFLAHRVIEGQRCDGIACAGDILIFCQQRTIVIPSDRPIFWLNFRIADYINSNPNGFDVEEITGIGPGANFRWKMK